MVAARDALSTLLTAPPWDQKQAMLNSTAAAISALQPAVNGAQVNLTAAVTTAQMLLGTGGPAEALNATLSLQDAVYSTARPCIMDLWARVQHINDSVIQLPGDLNQDLLTLNATRTELDLVLGVESGNGAAAQQLSEALINAQSALPQAQQALSDLTAASTQLASSNVGALVTGLQTMSSTMAAYQNTLFTLLDNMNAYASMSPGPTRYTRYVALVPQVQAAGAAAGTSAAGIQAWLNSAAPLFSEVNTFQDQLNQSDVVAQLNDISLSIKRLPESTSVTGQLGKYASEYATLPSPPSALLGSAEQALISVVNDVSGTITDTRDVLGNVVGDAESSLATVREKSVGKIEAYQAQYEPEARRYDTL